MKKAADSKFIGEEADRALFSCVENCSRGASLGVLLNYLKHKSATVRCKMAMAVHRWAACAPNKIAGTKEADRFVNGVSRMLADASQGTRQGARMAAAVLLQALSFPSLIHSLCRTSALFVVSP